MKKCTIVFCVFSLFFSTENIFPAGTSEKNIDNLLLGINDTVLESSIDRVDYKLQNVLKNTVDNNAIFNADTIGFIILDIDKNQIPHIYCIPDNNWNKSDTVVNEYIKAGESFHSLSFKTKNVQYYKYSAMNPLLAPNHSYNNSFYTTLEGEKKNVLDRFVFFRWTGSTMGIELDTYMYAVDTYTNFVFTYVKIGAWKEAFGVQVPLRYDPLDIYSLEDGQLRWFFEYDPVGYIAKDGELVFYDWYPQMIQKKLEEQLEINLPLGKSPYFVD